MKKKVLILAGVVALALFFVLSLSLRNGLGFRIASTDPRGNTIPTAQNFIRIKFNKQLDQTLNSRSVKVSEEASVKITGDTISIYLQYPPVEGQPIKVVLSDIKSQSGELMSRELDFTGGYVPFDKLSEEVRQSDLNSTDALEKTHPLIKKLPYEDESFSISYTDPDRNSTLVPLFVSNKEINYQDPFATQDSPTSLELLRTSRKKAITWLEANGYKKELYQLVFSEPFLLEEFGGIYVGDIAEGDH